MDMRMQAEVLPPGMKNTNGTALNCVMAVTKRSQCVPNGNKQMIVKPFTIQHANAMESLGNSEDNMIMIDRISMIHSLLDPERLVRTLALGTVAIATTIVTDLIATAMITLVLMATKG